MDSRHDFDWCGGDNGDDKSDFESKEWRNDFEDDDSGDCDDNNNERWWH